MCAGVCEDRSFCVCLNGFVVAVSVCIDALILGKLKALTAFTSTMLFYDNYENINCTGSFRIYPQLTAGSCFLYFSIADGGIKIIKQKKVQYVHIFIYPLISLTYY